MQLSHTHEQYKCQFGQFSIHNVISYQQQDSQDQLHMAAEHQVVVDNQHKASDIHSWLQSYM